METLKTTLNRLWSWDWKWCPTSPAELEDVETRMLKPVQADFTSAMVKIDESSTIRTIVIKNESPKTKPSTPHVPLVLVHGFGGGVGIWVKNLDELSRNQTVYAFDLLGFGRSSRSKFPDSDPAIVERQFVNSIESWRKAMGIERFILLGHSLGAYLAASYAIDYPVHVEHVILADPWGFPTQPTDRDLVPAKLRKMSWWIRAVVRVTEKFLPLAALRAAGPWGPGLVGTFRPDFKRRFESVFDDDTVLKYIYHCNAQNPSGEQAFKTMTKSFGWAKRPMIERVHQLDHNIPITMIYGSRSWMDISMGEKVKKLRPCSHVEVHIVDKAGHHVYSDQSVIFNNIVTSVCDKVQRDLQKDLQKTEI